MFIWLFIGLSCANTLQVGLVLYWQKFKGCYGTFQGLRSNVLILLDLSVTFKLHHIKRVVAARVSLFHLLRIIHPHLFSLDCSELCRRYLEDLLQILFSCSSVSLLDPEDRLVWLFAPGVSRVADPTVVYLDHLDLGRLLFITSAEETLVRVFCDLWETSHLLVEFSNCVGL
ncbi:hypothetical protein Hdeb2414_s0018g00515111 [Helianthus debilis subsp. tardiflorus]